MRNVDAFVLAGGESSRMGRNKALLELAGIPMILRMIRLVAPLVRRVQVVGPPELFTPFGLSAVPDDTPGLGPLGGIATALRCARTPWFLILGCDLPYLNRDWLRFLIDRALGSEAGAVIPVSAGGYEPLCAMYHERLAGPIAEALARGVRKVIEAFGEITIEVLRPEEWGEFDPDGLLFKNMNTPEDYEEAQRHFQGRGAD
jgi:molybdopterin-guanine dinucleotide biosynthesis protein A